MSAVDRSKPVSRMASLFGKRRASPRHMAVVTLLASLGQGLPLASMFKVYGYTMCRIHNGMHPSVVQIPDSPELPAQPNCDSPWVQQATSAYAAGMATVGALAALMILERATRLTDRFGRKVLLLSAILLLAGCYSVFNLSLVLSPAWATVVLFLAVVALEASQDTLLRVAIQQFIVDTTAESDRAGKLSFIDGVGQIGAFPSTTLGGLLAAFTSSVAAPFYACTAIFMVTFAYILVFVPESKRRHEATIIDQFGINSAEGSQSSEQGGDAGSLADTAHSHPSLPSVWWPNFLSPLRLMSPRSSGPHSTANWGPLNLAVMIVWEESFQVFIIPLLLLYNSDVLDLDVVQNGYMVTTLQGSRALFLSFIFPALMAQARKRWNKPRQDASGTEHEPLLARSRSNSSTWRRSYSAARLHRTEPGISALDIWALVISYLCSAVGFGMIAFSRHVGQPLLAQAAGIVLIELGSGATSIRLALFVNSVDADDESEALAACQMISSVVFATVPLLSSAVYSAGLRIAFPEMVWLLKSLFAVLAVFSAASLKWTLKSNCRPGTDI